MFEGLTQEEQDKITSGEAEQSLIDKMHRLHALRDEQPKGKIVNVQELQLYVNGEKFDHDVIEIEGDQERLWQRVRQGVIDDLRQRWGGDTTEALDENGYVVTLTVEQVADQAMGQHFERGMNDLNQPFSKRPTEQDMRTIYGKSASDMRGGVRVNGRETYADHKGVVTVDDIMPGSPITIDYPSYGWQPEKVLRRGSKTVPKPVRKVTLREKARAQRRARRKSR